VLSVARESMKKSKKGVFLRGKKVIRNFCRENGNLFQEITSFRNHRVIGLGPREIFPPPKLGARSPPLRYINVQYE